MTAVIDVQLPIVKMVYNALWQYYPFVVAAVLWTAYLVWRPEKAAGSTPGS